jgi:hypothetical protein
MIAGQSSNDQPKVNSFDFVDHHLAKWIYNLPCHLASIIK